MVVGKEKRGEAVIKGRGKRRFAVGAQLSLFACLVGHKPELSLVFELGAEWKIERVVCFSGSRHFAS